MHLWINWKWICVKTSDSVNTYVKIHQLQLISEISNKVFFFFMNIKRNDVYVCIVGELDIKEGSPIQNDLYNTSTINTE